MDPVTILGVVGTAIALAQVAAELVKAVQKQIYETVRAPFWVTDLVQEIMITGVILAKIRQLIDHQYTTATLIFSDEGLLVLQESAHFCENVCSEISDGLRKVSRQIDQAFISRQTNDILQSIKSIQLSHWGKVKYSFKKDEFDQWTCVMSRVKSSIHLLLDIDTLVKSRTTQPSSPLQAQMLTSEADTVKRLAKHHVQRQQAREKVETVVSHHKQAIEHENSIRPQVHPEEIENICGLPAFVQVLTRNGAYFEAVAIELELGTWETRQMKLNLTQRAILEQFAQNEAQAGDPAWKTLASLSFDEQEAVLRALKNAKAEKSGIQSGMGPDTTGQPGREPELLAISIKDKPPRRRYRWKSFRVNGRKVSTRHVKEILVILANVGSSGLSSQTALSEAAESMLSGKQPVSALTGPNIPTATSKITLPSAPSGEVDDHVPQPSEGSGAGGDDTGMPQHLDDAQHISARSTDVEAESLPGAAAWDRQRREVDSYALAEKYLKLWTRVYSDAHLAEARRAIVVEDGKVLLKPPQLDLRPNAEVDIDDVLNQQIQFSGGTLWDSNMNEMIRRIGLFIKDHKLAIMFAQVMKADQNFLYNLASRHGKIGLRVPADPRNEHQMNEAQQTSMDLVLLVLYDIVVFIDSKPSWAADDSIVADVGRYLSYITKAAGASHTGICQLYFPNSSAPYQIDENRVQGIEEVLKRHVTDPAERSSLSRPVLVHVMTAAEAGARDDLQAAIFRASRKLRAAGYPVMSFAVHVEQVGNEVAPFRLGNFLAAFERDSRVRSNVAAIMPFEYAQHRENHAPEGARTLTPTAWIMKLLIGAIDLKWKPADYSSPHWTREAWSSTSTPPATAAPAQGTSRAHSTLVRNSTAAQINGTTGVRDATPKSPMNPGLQADDKQPDMVHRAVTDDDAVEPSRPQVDVFDDSHAVDDSDSVPSEVADEYSSNKSGLSTHQYDM
ncbi:hypothetical protein PV11_02172 [Exophiala sideris]|uniref:Fungal N-terminal domain-containing protein n=1 Tax=Exophiala sideris TaxID=1016849 RepID=A0A0D1XEU7_9EURO|nr:hypothetical protein PV11_02172 [Exophiala sideris]